MKPTPSDLSGWLGSASKRAQHDIPFSSISSPDDWAPPPPTPPKRRRRPKAAPPNLLIPETLDGEQMGDFLMRLAVRKPRKMRKLIRLMTWLDEEGRREGVW